MFHYKIAILHAKRCLLQTLVPPINTVYLFYLSMPSYVLSSYVCMCVYVCMYACIYERGYTYVFEMCCYRRLDIVMYIVANYKICM